MMRIARHIRSHTMRISTAALPWTWSPPWRAPKPFRFRFRAEPDRKGLHFGQPSIGQSRLPPRVINNGGAVMRMDRSRDEMPRREWRGQRDEDLDDWQEVLKEELQDLGIELPRSMPFALWIGAIGCFQLRTGELPDSLSRV